MNDEQFEATMECLRDELADKLSARDTAQREAVEAWKAAHAREATALAQAWDQRDIAQAQLAEAVGLLEKVTRTTGWDHRDGPLLGMVHDFLVPHREAAFMKSKGGSHAQAEQQEAKPTAEQLKMLDRFRETCTDGEAYDVPVETMHQLAAIGLVDPAPEHGEHGFSMNAKGRAALASQQDAQGAQAGDERAAFEKWFDDYSLAVRMNGGMMNDAQLYDAWQARAALATQPADGEPVYQWRFRDDKYWIECSRKTFEQYSEAPHAVQTRTLYTAPPAAAPVAAGEPKQYWAFRNEDNELCITDRWDVAKHFPFDLIPLVDRVTVVTPPAAAHGDEAVRKDAEAAYIEMTCQPVLIDGAHHYYLSSERMQAFDRLFSVDVGDAAIRGQAGEGGEV